MKGKTVTVVVFVILSIMFVGFLAKLTANFTNFNFSSINEAARQLFGM